MYFNLKRNWSYFGRIYMPAGARPPSALDGWKNLLISGVMSDVLPRAGHRATYWDGLWDVPISGTVPGGTPSTQVNRPRTYWFAGTWAGTPGQPDGAETKVDLTWVAPDTATNYYVHDLYASTGVVDPAPMWGSQGQNTDDADSQDPILHFAIPDQGGSNRVRPPPSFHLPGSVIPDDSPSDDEPSAPAKSSALLWILGGLAVVGIGVAVAMSGKDEKKAKRNPATEHETIRELADDDLLRAAHIALAPAHMASLLAEDVDDADEANRRVFQEMADVASESEPYVIRASGEEMPVAGARHYADAKRISRRLASHFHYGVEIVRTSDGAVDSGDGFE